MDCSQTCSKQHQTLAAADHRLAFQELFEIAVVTGVFGILIYLSLSELPSHLNRAAVTEALFLGVSYREQLLMGYAETGEWKPLVTSNRGSGRYVNSVVAAKGTGFNVIFNQLPAGVEQGSVLSIRPATLPGVSGSPVVWLCGNRLPRGGYRVHGVNETNIAPQNLPNYCKK
ncbi:MAG: hypothetical protein AAF438_09675 [Pseudomonadota bacterium]